MLRILGRVLGCLVAPGTALAFDLPVAYDVDGKSFKTVGAGDVLVWELFGDAACSELLHSELVTAGEEGLRARR